MVAGTGTTGAGTTRARPLSTGGGGGAVRLATVAIVAVAVLAAIWMLTRTDRPFELSLDPKGSVKIEARAGDSFSGMLAGFMDKDPRTVEALLGTYDFYRIDSTRLVDAMARIDARADSTAAVTHGMRELLWNLAGPFERPGTFAGADERLIGALDDLEAGAGAGQASRLLAAIWERSLDRTGVFRPRSFNADVKRVFGGQPAAGQVVIYACPGSGFVGKTMTLWTEGERSGAVTGMVDEDLLRFDCGSADKTLGQLLAGEPARLALDGATYAKLFGPAGAAAGLPPRIDAKFRIYPKETTAAVQIPERG